VTALLALAASLLWGSADFGGGLLSRKLPVSVVMLSSQVIGLVVLVLGLALPGVHVGTGAYLGYASAAGLANLAGIYFFYRAMARGPMSLAAPISACGAVLPVAFGLARGEAVTAPQAVGIAAALLGVVLASSSQLRGGTAGAGGTILFALGAAMGFGSMFLFAGLASTHSVYGTMLTENVIGVLVLIPVVLTTGGIRREAWTPRLTALALAVGLGDIGANAAFLGATHSGHIAVASVLGSLYPLASSLMARVLLAERLRPVQNLGVLIALSGILLINL